MGFTGLTVSDYASITEMHTRFKLYENKTDAGEQALRAGMYVELPSKDCYNDELMERFREGRIEMEILNNSVRSLVVSKFELGLFENPLPKPKEEILKVFNDKKNMEIGLEMARASLVLIKNNNKVLPLERKPQRIAAIGHHAASVRSLFGGYSFATLAENMLGMGNTMAGVDIEQISNLSLDEFGRDRDNYTYPGSVVRVEPPKVEELVRKLYPQSRSLLDGN